PSRRSGAVDSQHLEGVLEIDAMEFLDETDPVAALGACEAVENLLVDADRERWILVGMEGTQSEKLTALAPERNAGGFDNFDNFILTTLSAVDSPHSFALLSFRPPLLAGVGPSFIPHNCSLLNRR